MATNILYYFGVQGKQTVDTIAETLGVYKADEEVRQKKKDPINRDKILNYLLLNPNATRSMVYTKTRTMYDDVKRLLATLSEEGLVVSKQVRRHQVGPMLELYSITEKGIDYVRSREVQEYTA